MRAQASMTQSLPQLRAKAGKALALLPLFALGACWTSQGPLIPAAQIDPPPISGKYRSSQFVDIGNGGRGSGGRIFEHKILTASGRGLAVQTYRDDAPDPKPDGALLFDKLNGDVYLVQSTDADGATFYGLLRIVNKTQIKIYTLSCNDAAAGANGVTRDGNLCVFRDYDTVRRLATGLLPSVMNDTYKSLDEMFDPQQAFYGVSGYVRE
ncbi:MAG: hypothetical protein GC147_00515 [Porphyrobacter sp.]|nr:hypothetical protein [Porphyrobacter sp.]